MCVEKFTLPYLRCVLLHLAPVAILKTSPTELRVAPSAIPELPAYSSREELLEKLHMALDSFEADPSFGQE